MRRHLRNRPNDTVNRNNLAAAILRQGRYDEAITEYTKALPSKTACLNLGILAAYDGARDKAVDLLHRAIALDPTDPSYHHDLATIHLLFGEWEVGWEEYEWRWLGPQCKDQIHAPELRWRGQKTGKPILVTTEQGMGDTIQFMRYCEFVPDPIMIVHQSQVSFLSDNLITPVDFTAESTSVEGTIPPDQRDPSGLRSRFQGGPVLARLPHSRPR